MTPALAQLDQGQISGTVHDPAGSVVVGAKITATNTKLGETHTAQSGSNGYFVITNLPVGLYDVSVQAPGFKVYLQQGLKLDAASRVSIQADLEVGSVTETVNVSAPTADLQSESAQIGRVVDSKQVTDLALNGRNPIDLALTQAGVVGGNFNNFNPVDLSANFTINGGQYYGNNITVDGVQIVRTRGDGQGAPTVLGIFNVDAIQEVQILTSSYPAEYGNSMTGQVRLVTKAGTRDFHGSAFEFFRNSNLDANSWTRNNSHTQDANSAAPLHYNQPGYAIGGPVFIPKHWNTDRNKLFFFFSQEWISYHQTAESTGTVPSLLMRQGNFSELLSPKNPYFNSVQIVKNPSTGAPYPNNIIPASDLSHNGLGLLSAFPAPTPGFQQGAANWYASQPSPNESRKDTIRVDYNIGNTRLSLSGTIFSFHEDDPFRTGFDVADTRWDRPNKTGAFSVLTAISPSMTNEFTFTGAYDKVSMHLYPIDGINRWERSLYGIDFPYVIPGPKRLEDRIPTIQISGFSELDGSSKPGFSSGPMYTASDNFTHVLNSGHTLKYGVWWELAKQVNADQIGTNQNGWFTFQNGGIPLSTGVAIGNAAMGNFNTYAEIGPAADTTVVSNAVEAFAQDTWKVTPRLTIEYGIRYSYFQPWYAIWNDIANFDPRYYTPGATVVSPTTGAIVSGSPYNGIVLPGSGYPASAAGRAQGAFVPGVQALFHNLPRGFVNSYYGNFAPRFGLAWRITDHTVLRTGGGSFKTRMWLLSGDLFRNPPNQASANSSNGSVDNPGAAGETLPSNIGALANEYRYPTAYNYSFSIQHEFPGAYVLDLSYVGNVAVNLERNGDINSLPLGSIYKYPNVNPNALRPYAGFTNIYFDQQSGRSTYNSLQVTLDHRFQSGLGFGLAYTFSKSLDDIQFPYYGSMFVWAPSRNDHTQVLNLTYIYELPFFRHSRGLLKNTLGDWQISGVTAYRSGDPLSVVDGNDNAGIGSGDAGQPWNLVGSPSYLGPTGVGNLWFNPAAFAVPAKGTLGNAGLGILRGPWFFNWDVALFKNFTIHDVAHLQFRAEAFDFPNHPVLANPQTSPTSGSFGRITSKSDNRNLQLGLKLTF